MEDNQNDPAFGLEAVRKLVEKEKVFAVVGSLADDPHAASWEYLNENEVPDILVSAGADRFGTDPEGHPWTVQMIPSYVTEGVVLRPVHLREPARREGGRPLRERPRRSSTV